jgi:hypothetical protein
MSRARRDEVPAMRKLRREHDVNWLKIAIMVLAGCPGIAVASEAVSCGGAAMLGGAQLNTTSSQGAAPVLHGWALRAGDQKLSRAASAAPGNSNVTVRAAVSTALSLRADAFVAAANEHGRYGMLARPADWCYGRITLF